MRTLQIQNSTLYVGESYRNLKRYVSDTQIILITDENVYAHYNSFLADFDTIIIPTGEKIKTWKTVDFIINQLLERGADRSTFLVGFGGGVVTDITGFVASVFMRGLRFGFVATSLLAQVDASLGGKNGINFQQYKNTIGVFNSPKFVICDAELLKTLSSKELRSGFGEIIKHALIKNANLFDFLSENSKRLQQLDNELMEKVIWEAIQVKAGIVEEDWKEKGIRKQLNFGHTVGHAIENNSTFTHGEAVSAGMFWAAKWSVKKGFLESSNLHKINEILQDFQLPTIFEVPTERLAKFIVKDKKKQGEAIDFVFLEQIGKAKVVSVSIEELLAEIKQ